MITASVGLQDAHAACAGMCKIQHIMHNLHMALPNAPEGLIPKPYDINN